MSAGSGLIDSGDHGGATGRADGCGHVAAGKAKTVLAELVESGRLSRIHREAIGFHPRGKILTKDPEDIWFISGGNR